MALFSLGRSGGGAGPAGRVWRGRPALPGADSALSESSLQEHSRPRVSSSSRPWVRQRPPSFSAPRPGPAARCPLRRSAEIRASSGARPRPGGGAATRSGAQLELDRSQRERFSKGPGRKAGRGLCKGCRGCSGAQSGAAEDRLAPFPGLFPALRQL